ncbi:MAG: serine hydrolase, partial [Candidatus Komeilibacteria bacterium]|nr:serine hydrolase [Candidatus Komeilibacteria bacterium]
MFRLLISLLIVCFSGLWLKPAELAESYQIPTEITGQSSSSLQQLVKPIWLSPLKLKNAAPAWPVVSAQAAAVVDWETGQILWQKNPSQVVTLASLTKLMTALVVLENYWQPQMVVEVPAAAVAANLKSYLQPGDKTSLAELLRILLAASSNEAAETLATQFGREKFIAAM